MILDDVAEWFDWVDAGGEGDLSVRLDAFNRIIERLILLKVAFHFYGLHFRQWGRMRQMALSWRTIYHVLKGMLEAKFTNIDEARRDWFVEDKLTYAMKAIRYFVPECVMLVAPEKPWEEDEELVSA